MTVILPQFSEPSPTTELILYVDNLRPIRLADFAKTLSALSADYSAATGRNLVVSGFEQGSLSAIFREAAEYADSANHLRRLQISLNFGITLHSDVEPCAKWAENGTTSDKG
jgi:hypothetical protein